MDLLLFCNLTTQQVLQLCFLEVMPDGRTVITAVKLTLQGVLWPTAASCLFASDCGAAA